MRSCAGLLATLVVSACGDKGTSRVAEAPGVTEVEAPAPELALRVSESVTVWYTGARADTAADGRTCIERVMEIRTGTRVVPVPLLYTAEIPTLANDTTIEVRIWRHCVPADRYRVHLRTGQPTRTGS